MTIIKKIIKKIVLKIMTKDKLLYYMLDLKKKKGILDTSTMTSLAKKTNDIVGWYLRMMRYLNSTYQAT